MKIFRQLIMCATVAWLLLLASGALAQTDATKLLLSKAQTLERRGRIDLAAKVWEQVLLADPKDVDAIAGMVRYSQQSGNPDAARTYLDQLKKISPEARVEAADTSPGVDAGQQAKLQEAGRLSAQHNSDTAMRIYREVLGDHPPEGDLSIAYYETLASTTGGMTNAIAHLRDLAKSHPDDSRYTLVVGRLLTYDAHTRLEGLKTLESIPANDTSASAARDAWKQALIWERSNPVYQASLREYLSRYPDPDLEAKFGPIRPMKSQVEQDAEHYEQAGYQALRENNTEEADGLFEKLRANPAGATPGLIGLGFVRMKQQDFAAAQQLLETAKSRSTAPNRTLDQALETARFWHNMSDATHSLDENNLDQALKSFQAAYSLRSSSPEAIAGLAGTMMRAGQPANAAPLFRKLVQVASNDPKAWQGLLKSLQQSGDGAGAITASKNMPANVREACMEEPECLLPLSAAYKSTGNADESRSLLQRAVQVSVGAKGSPEMQMQVAGLLAETGNFGQATDLYVRLAQQDPKRLDIWEGLIGALHQANKDPEALAVSAKMPPEVYDKALEKTDFLMMMASIYEAQEQIEPAHRLLEQALKRETAGGKDAPLPLQLQIGSLWLKEKEYLKASDLFSAGISRYPENLAAWRGEFTSLHESGHDEQAIALLARVPDTTRHLLENDPDILALLAFSYSSQKQNDIAVRLVRQAAWQYQSARKTIPVDLELESCWIFLSANQEASLSSQIRHLSLRSDLIGSQRKSLGEVWAAWSMKKADAAAATANYNLALSILYAARRAFPDDLKIRSAFANTLMRGGYARQAFDEYRNWGLIGGDRDDYVGALGAAIGAHEFKSAEAWLNTSLSQWQNDPKLLTMGAKLAVARGDYTRANRYYQAALAQTTPDSNPMGLYGAPSDPTTPNQTVAIQNLADLLAPVSPVGRTAQRENNQPAPPADDSVSRLLAGLSSPEIYSSNPVPTQLFGQGSEGLGDSQGSITLPNLSEHGKPQLSSSASGSGQATSNISGPAAQLQGTTQTESLDWLLQSVDQNRPGSQELNPPRNPLALPGTSQLVDQSLSNENTIRPMTAPRPEGNTPVRSQVQSATQLQIQSPASSDQWVPSSNMAAGSPQPSGGNSSFTAENFLAGPSKATAGAPVNPSPREEVETEIAGMNAQLSPYFGSQTILRGRSGQAGFDRLLSQQTNIEASTTLGNSVRMTVISSPVVLDAGTPNGQATIQLGSLGLGSATSPMGAAGVGAEVQVATENLGVRLGVTPRGFPIENVMGGIQYRPEGGPVVITAYRNPVTDTLLSYAGIRDPGTGQVWGGVLANGVSGLGSWGTAASGIYGGLGYQYIIGTGVANNTREDATVGSYWRIISKANGALMVGINFSGMHYEKNLRYFTLGQGGYFSPQSYLLFNVPVHWQGTYNSRFEYSADASLGSQHFQEDSSPFFPLQAPPTPTNTFHSKIGNTVLFYPSQVSTGANYSMVLKSGYRLSTNWLLGGFLDFNNTQNYVSKTFGFYVRYQFRPIPFNSSSNTENLPDWNALRPLILK
jgi:tetratricopeptide (TPR) repeat protein